LPELAASVYNKPSATPYFLGTIRPCPTGGSDAILARESAMEWTKPEATVVAVTMEVTAYAATK
jgi:hypothetical protein